MARTKLQTPNFNLLKRGDGYYEIRYTENGVQKRKATGTKEPVAAETARARFVAEYRRPHISAARPTVSEVCDAYMATRERKVACPKTLPYSFNPIKRHLGFMFADAITQTVIDDYIEDRQEDVPDRKGGRWKDQPVGEATISKELRMFRAALNWAAAERKIERLPSFKIELSTGNTRVRWITKDDANKLVAEAPPYLALFILIALSTAKRREAILSLKWDKVNLSMQGFESIDFGDDVGNKRRGSASIAKNSRLINALKEAKAKAKTEFVIEYRGSRVADIKKSLKAACERAGIEPISAHVLKHSSVTWMVMSGTSFERIAFATNTSKEIIERVYGHFSPSFIEEVTAAVSF
jgi:integrase